MVVSCSAFGCTNKYKEDASIQFHKFPLENPELLNKWMDKIKNNNFKPTECNFLCSEHFVTEDYQYLPGAEVKLLKDNAFPTVFKCLPNYLPQKLPYKRPILQRSMINKVSVQEIPTSSSQCTVPLVGSEKVTVVSSPELLIGYDHKYTQFKLKSSKNQVLHDKIKVLQKRLKGRDLKIKSLKTMLYNMKKIQAPLSDDETTIQLEEQRFGTI